MKTVTDCYLSSPTAIMISSLRRSISPWKRELKERGEKSFDCVMRNDHFPLLDASHLLELIIGFRRFYLIMMCLLKVAKVTSIKCYDLIHDL